MTFDQSVVLGIVQGITEFLPISSSGHLILIPEIFGWGLQSLTFDLGLHAGTALAILLYFFRDWKNMTLDLFRDIFSIILSTKRKIFDISILRPSSLLLLKIIVAIVPVGIIGLIFDDKIEENFRSPLLVSVMMIVISVYMTYAEFFSKKKIPHPNSVSKSLNSFKNVLIISLSQIVALIPGSSRSGMTISTALILGYTHEQAARLSFLLATPIIVGAVLTKIPEILNLRTDELVLFALGFFTSFVVGLLSIKFLLKFLKKHGLLPFVVYRILFAFLTLVLILARSR